MEDSERYEALSPTEIAALRKKSQGARNILILMVVFFIGLIAFGVRNASWLTIIAMIAGALLVIWFVIRGQLRSVRSLNRDIHDGKKKIVVAHLESQRQDIRQTGNNSDVVDEALGTSGPAMSYSYLLKVRGKEYKVSESQYYQCKPGQLVELHLAPHSEHLFSLKVLEDGRTERGPS